MLEGVLILAEAYLNQDVVLAKHIKSGRFSGQQHEIRVS